MKEAFLRTALALRCVVRRPGGKHSNSNQKQQEGVDETMTPFILPDYLLCM